MSVTRHIPAPRQAVYDALLDPDAVAAWRVPDGMTAVVHALDARVGGAFRVSLTYDEPGVAGKTTGRTDTYHGRFTALAAGERVVEVIEFETDDPTLQGEMTVTTTLADADGGTQVTIAYDGLPRGIAPGDNEAGTRMALDRLAGLLRDR
ncbi:MAG TPA: SRPBCC domain-containing protein [Solirubrobacteraceae bacterium]|nr:SRPBCC domain-containing protein [Solirubrobacteraceae bacterium]